MSKALLEKTPMEIYEMSDKALRKGVATLTAMSIDDDWDGYSKQISQQLEAFQDELETRG